MAITYHAGRRLQGLSTDATAVTNGTASSGTAVVFDASSEVGSGNGISYSGNVISVKSGVNVAPNYADVAITATAKLKIPSSGVSEFSVTVSAMSNGGWGKMGLSSTQTNSTTANQADLCQFGFRIADDNRAWYFDSTGTAHSGTSFTGGADTYKITVNSSGVVKFYKGSTLVHTSSNTASGDYYMMAIPYLYNGSATHTFTYSGDYVETTTGVKPTNVQVGSRFEETDTRKMYHYSDNGITGSDVSSSELKAYYKFDESSGNIVNVANTITGNSTLGTGQNITMNGDPTYSVTGTPSSFGNAVSCDGSGDYGQFGTKTDWNFLHTTGATWTINVWLKFDASVVTNKILFDNTQAADSTIGLNIRTQSSNRFRVIIPRGVGNSSTLDTDNNPNLPIPTDNAWHMYTIRWDQSSGNGVLTYKTDGANEVTKNGSGNGTTTSDCTDSPRLFSESDAVSGELDAEIAEMSIWNRILTTAEETALYNSGSGKIIATDPSWKEEGT